MVRPDESRRRYAIETKCAKVGPYWTGSGRILEWNGNGHRYAGRQKSRLAGVARPNYRYGKPIRGLSKDYSHGTTSLLSRLKPN